MNGILAESFDMSTPDTKVLYVIAMLNELHIGDPGLAYMQQLIAVKSKYDKAIVSLRFLMKRKELVLTTDSNHPQELVDDFNSDMSDEDFTERLSTSRTKAPKAIEKLRRLIKQQEFNK